MGSHMRRTDPWDCFTAVDGGHVAGLLPSSMCLIPTSLGRRVAYQRLEECVENQAMIFHRGRAVMKPIIAVFFSTIIVISESYAEEKADDCEKDSTAVVTALEGGCHVFRTEPQSARQRAALGTELHAGQSLLCDHGSHLTIMFCATRRDKVITHNPEHPYVIPNVPSKNPEAEDNTREALRLASGGMTFWSAFMWFVFGGAATD